MKKKLARLAFMSVLIIAGLLCCAPVYTYSESISPIVTTIETTIETTSVEEEPSIETTIIEETEPIVYEYPEAQQVWDTLRGWGWSPETCAGIIGNIMAEIGGGTLDFSDWDSNGKSGYGMIQWLGSRRKLIKKLYGTYPTIEEQLIFMRDEMFGTNGVPRQISEKVCNQILNGTDPATIAFEFADHFERCAENHKSIRRKYAKIAYNYFMNQ
jgi:hypothetical protein